MRSLPLEHQVRLVISGQVLLATVLLCMGEGNVWLPLATLVILAVSAYLTDVKKRFYLRQPTADVLALGVVVVSVFGALQTDRAGLLVTVGNLQSYLQYVVLFQRKTPRVYWQLALLSLGQVAVASTLVPGPAFGVMLVIYLLVGTVGFALLLLHTESAGLSVAAQPARAGATGDAAILGRPVLRGGAAPIDGGTAGRGLPASAVLVVAVTVVFGAALFFVLPRWHVANYEVDNNEPLRTVGFSSTVLLGELGEVVENSDTVMRIQFLRGRGNRAIQLEGEPLLRGTVVTRYEGRTWSRDYLSNPVILPTEPKNTIVRQRITAEPLDVGELFCVFPVYAVDEPDTKLRMNASYDQLIRLEEYRNHTLEFEVATTGITGNRQRDLVPCGTWISRRDLARLRDEPPAEKFAGLIELAAGVVSEQDVDPSEEPARAARALSESFRVSGQFFYSLSPQERDERVDPLEDFVTTNRSGHCEYFAGALVLMLRSVGIPARMAIGFKGGEWNPLGRYYQVQQLHAHAWVEVYLKRDEIPPGTLAREEVPHGAWLVLDPTAGIQEGDAGSQNTGFLARIRQSIDYARVLWINYVASLNEKRQRQGIYAPLAAGFDAAIDNLTNPKVWRARFEMVRESPVGKFWRWYRRHWFSWRGGLVAVGFSLLVVAASVAVRALAGVFLRRGWFGGGQAGRRAPVLEIYRRLERALQQAGFVRHRAQTAHEFAVVAGGELAARVEFRRVAHLPRSVVDSFYRVRFGGRTLDKREAEAVEHALAELELVLSRASRR